MLLLLADNMALLGSIERKELRRVMEDQFSEDRENRHFAGVAAANTTMAPLLENTARPPEAPQTTSQVVETKNIVVNHHSTFYLLG